MNKDELLSYQATNNSLKDKVILVTGAGSGLGKAIAVDYAKHGATVILLSKTIAKLEAVYDEIDALGGPQAAIYPLNHEGATRHDYETLAEVIENEFGRLDGLVINAAWVGMVTPVKLYDPEIWQKVMTVNLHAPIAMTQCLLPLLEATEGSAIIASSQESSRAYWGAFGIAKAGMDSFIKILADEYETKNRIRVNAIDTGPVRTNMRAHNYPGENPQDNPLAEEMTGPYLYCMDPANDITGQILRFQEDRTPKRF